MPRKALLTIDELREVRRLREAGMSVPDVVIAMEIFHHSYVTAAQVERLAIRRGRRPDRAIRADVRQREALRS